MHRPDFAVFILMSWGFRCRVQSEAVPWQAGEHRDLITLPTERHSAIVFEGFSEIANCNTDCGFLHCRWRRRKQRPEGSWLKRQCDCKGRGNPQLCLVHRAMDYINQTKLKHGGELFPEISGWSGLCLLRRILKMLSVGTADAFTWKCIRAGKATAMAGANMPLQEFAQQASGGTRGHRANTT